jgi:hypothetical protein
VIIASPTRGGRYAEDCRIVTSKSQRVTMSQRITGRRVFQLAAAGLVASSGVMLLLPAPSAGAANLTPGVIQGSWFWQTAYEQANPPVAPPAVPPSEPSGVPDGDLAVAYTGAQDPSGDKTPAKMTALAFDTTGLTPGSSVQSFTFSLTLDTQPTATNFAQQDAMIVACLPTRAWPATPATGGDYTDEPTYDCGNAVKPTVVGNVYTFAIPTIAQTWIDDQNLGVAVLPDPKNTTAPFQLVFTGPKTVKASMAYTPGTPIESPPPPTTGTGGGYTPPPVTGGGGTDPGTGPISVGGVTSPAPVPTPVVAPSSPAPSSTPVAAIRPASSAPSAGFWVVAALLGVFMLIVSLVLGDPSPPVTAGGRSKLDQVLRDRGSDAFTVRSD